MPVILWTLTSGVFLTIGDIVLRIWLPDRWQFGFALVFSIYMLGIFCMMMSFFGQNIAIATVAAVLVNVVGYLLAAYFLFGDTISILQISGCSLGLIAIAILELA